MNGILAFLALVLVVGVLVFAPSDGAGALVICGVTAIVTGLLLSRIKAEKSFLLRLFVGGLLLRVLIGTVIYALNLQEFFGGDAFTYDFNGYALLQSWQGDAFAGSLVKRFISDTGANAWGMFYLVASIYGVAGRNMLAVQFFNAVLGAATAPVIFLCAQHIFQNNKVARYSAYFVAFYPSLVLWSSQGLKDGPIVFLLALCVLATLKLGENLSFKFILLLAGSLFALLSLRFYIFYMMIAAIAGAFTIGMRAMTAQGFLRQAVVIIVVGLSLTYVGVTRYANVQYETFGNLEALQRTRSDLARSAESGFSNDADVSTTSGALTAMPIGLTYLLLAPFPWQLVSLRQSITLPEMIVWWLSVPLLVLGLWFAVKHRLRQASPVLIFISMLTLAYSLFQGNVGTAYRQRAQLLVFYFIFVAVGIVLVQEKREDRKRRISQEQRELEARHLADLANRRRSGPYPYQWNPGSESNQRTGTEIQPAAGSNQ